MRFLWPILFFSLVGVQLRAQTLDSSELIGWWPLDGSISDIAIDVSAFHQNGSISGNPQRDQGRFGQAILFDGTNDYIDCGTNSRFDITDAITVCAWIKIHRFNAKFQTIIAKGDSAWRLARDGATNFIQFSCNSYKKTNFWSARGNTNVNDGQWHHVAGVFDGKNAYLYVNGLLDTSLNSVSKIDTNTLPVFIGNNPEFTDRYWNGWIDDVRIYKRALTDVEISQLSKWSGIYERAKDEIAKNPSEIINQMQIHLNSLGPWRTNSELKEKYAPCIANGLLNIARAKRVLNLAQNDLERSFLEITEEFPDTIAATKALYEWTGINLQNSIKAVAAHLKGDTRGTRTAQWYGSQVGLCLRESNYRDATQHIKELLKSNISVRFTNEMPELFFQSLGLSSDKYYIPFVWHHILQHPDSDVSCVFLRHRLSKLARQNKSQEQIDLISRIRTSQSETKLAACATEFHANTFFKLGHYLYALEVIQPGILSPDRDEVTITDDLDSLLTTYANVRAEPVIDHSHIYKRCAMYAQNLGLFIVACHCYRRCATIRGCSLIPFESHNVVPTNQKDIPARAEIWFWRGMIHAKDENLASAAMAYATYLQYDKTSVLAARALYDTARARLTAGQYEKAQYAIRQAKKLSPCPLVLELELRLHQIYQK